MEKGWNAKGLLAPHWGKVGGRDELAQKTGIQPGTLSGYNTGRLPLGLTNATRIAEVLEISVLDLGAPPGSADERGLGVRDRLEELAERLSDLAETVHELGRENGELRDRLSALESQRTLRRAAAKGQASGRK